MVHQGKKVEEIIQKRGISKAELGRRIKTSNQNIHDIISREKIKTDLLERLGIALEFDFFQEFFGKTENEAPIDDKGTISDHIKERYVMQGRLEQMEVLLKSRFSKDISESIMGSLDRQLSSIANQLEAILENQEKINKDISKSSGAQKKA